MTQLLQLGDGLILLGPEGKYRKLLGPAEGGPDDWTLHEGHLCSAKHGYYSTIQDCLAGGPEPYPKELQAVDLSHNQVSLSHGGTDADADAEKQDTEAQLVSKIQQQKALADNYITQLVDKQAQLARIASRKRAAQESLAASAAKRTKEEAETRTNEEGERHAAGPGKGNH